MRSEGQREYSIGELAAEAGVSTRTIRYYVSEGLLPPPVGAGPGSRYTEAHREQLELIGRLKAQYLPLKEIRRRLVGHGLPTTGSAPTPDRGVQAMAPPARAPLPRRPDVGEETLPIRRLVREEDAAGPPPMVARAAEFSEPADVSYSMPAPAVDEAQPSLWRSPVPAGERTWRRVAISEEAELLITESQYHRHQDKIDWLVQWAKRVLDG